MTGAAIIIGAGDATGGAIAAAFARDGLTAVPVRRNADALAPLAERILAAGHACVPIGTDARDEAKMVALFDRVEADIGPVEVAVFNIGANSPMSILEETERRYRKIWELCALGGFLMGREAARRMVPRGRGTILFTGATAAVRGGAGFAAFAGGKHALRALAQSMARELGPRGLHVGHVVIAGAIDTEFIRSQFPERYARKAEAGILDPDHIAANYVMLHHQPRDAWTHELDLRPWVEPF
ncbi:SDR family NAD(P)-dependent oxidoreductase [Polymorphobacter fuscus]|uniref:SDR family NAD(P)-dependent oxidoreductase n=1 Tax=Sandarakinorhabdus fusca TaxID=1439888 RepID=A0A7C9GSV6_9SPHN|nr:SDR family NAD(P)-dependent oxidoreductase [Polymorphobacter fuscus]KAB7648523.1 SDR family NAD(P)-dependent oxidoreductase [Polymorphobacter fuscus]MQT16058.1 SDR family NAD(P)-dependent oxidoreductase [Polymorphobacter fuscus]NJC07664.1 NAD(P)-dependent dehydrogenase (short-subunit alcohol dehydrogenase family) [Polymorphobacter fuscus]